MRFENLGDPNGPVLVLMGWPFSTCESLRSVAELLPECRVILPTWDGQDGGGIAYPGRREEAAQILAELKANDIRQVSLAGISLGAATALDLAELIVKDGSVQLNGILCDGGTFLRRSLPRRLIRGLIVGHLFRKVRKGTEEEAVSALTCSRWVRLLTGKAPTAYRVLLTDMARVARVIEHRSIRAEEKALCTFDWPALPDEIIRRTVFLWSGRDPARHANRRLRKHYPNAVYQTIGQLGHGGLAICEPQTYALLLCGMVMKNRT